MMCNVEFVEVRSFSAAAAAPGAPAASATQTLLWRTIWRLCKVHWFAEIGGVTGQFYCASSCATDAARTECMTRGAQERISFASFQFLHWPCSAQLLYCCCHSGLRSFIFHPQLVCVCRPTGLWRRSKSQTVPRLSRVRNTQLKEPVAWLSLD